MWFQRIQLLNNVIMIQRERDRSIQPLLDETKSLREEYKVNWEEDRREHKKSKQYKHSQFRWSNLFSNLQLEALVNCVEQIYHTAWTKKLCRMDTRNGWSRRGRKQTPLVNWVKVLILRFGEWINTSVERMPSIFILSKSKRSWNGICSKQINHKVPNTVRGKEAIRNWSFSFNLQLLTADDFVLLIVVVNLLEESFG